MIYTINYKKIIYTIFILKLQNTAIFEKLYSSVAALEHRVVRRLYMTSTIKVL